MKTPSLAFDRWDYGATKLLLVGGLVLVPLLLVVLPAAFGAAGRPLTTELAIGDPQAVTGLDARAGVEAEWAGSALVTFDEPDAGLVVLNLLPWAVVAVAAMLVLWALLRLTLDVQRGQSFTGRAVRRLRVVGLTLIVAPWLHQAVASVVGAQLLDAAFGRSGEITIAIGGAQLAISGLGLVVGVLGEAFQQGNVLRDDVDGLV